jgi:hypothetical protein
MRKFTLSLSFLLSFVFAFSQVTLDSELLEHYDLGTEQYIPNEMIEHLYDGNGNLTESISYSWNGSTWDENEKEAYTYDVNNNRTNNTNSFWNSTVWDDNYKTDYTYNGSNQITGFIGQDWDGSQWVNSSGIANVTYVSDKITGYSEYSWNGSSWEEILRGTINYNSLILDYILYEDWNGSQWVNSELETYTINGSTGAIEQQLIEGWNGSSWDLGAKFEYFLDGSFNRTSYIESDYYTTDWTINFSYINTFDFTTLMSTIYHPFDNLNYDLGLEDFPYTDRILHSIESNESGDISSRTTYSYSDDVLNVIDFNQFELEVYPNPTSDYIHINIGNFDMNASLEIFNLLGKQVKTSYFYGNSAFVDIGHLAKGFYLLKVNSNGKVVTKKIIKK